MAADRTYPTETFDAAVTVADVQEIDDGQLRIRLVRIGREDVDAGADDEDAGVAVNEWDVTTSHLSNLPKDLVKRGDVLDLHHGATTMLFGTERSFILSSGARPVLFGTHHRGELSTELEAFGISVEYGPEVCESHGPTCDFASGGLIVTRNGQEATVPLAEPVRIADLVVGGHYSRRLPDYRGFCDATGSFHLVGYTVK